MTEQEETNHHPFWWGFYVSLGVCTAPIALAIILGVVFYYLGIGY